MEMRETLDLLMTKTFLKVGSSMAQKFSGLKKSKLATQFALVSSQDAPTIDAPQYWY
ncbi:hypothetical protein [Pseudomonas kairouanensis]|uniref:hypothetical protein n=1 Tax=Pseudomonas kairouanensis TaxID=2293832 RepID=UPI003B526460